MGDPKFFFKLVKFEVSHTTGVALINGSVWNYWHHILPWLVQLCSYGCWKVL